MIFRSVHFLGTLWGAWGLLHRGANFTLLYASPYDYCMHFTIIVQLLFGYCTGCHTATILEVARGSIAI